MAAKWQRWMPMEIDALKASPAVQAMHPCARAGYVWLLLDAWQTEDCTIPTDPIDLADKSGLGDELWAVHGLRILRKFEQVNGLNRLRNLAQYERWKAAKAVYEGRMLRRNCLSARARGDCEYEIAMYSILNHFGNPFLDRVVAPYRLTGEIWQKIRARIFSRDSYTCQYCGVSKVDLECDHIIPLSGGGSNEDSNLTTSCVSCNRSKYTKTVDEWRLYLALKN